MDFQKLAACIEILLQISDRDDTVQTYLNGYVPIEEVLALQSRIKLAAGITKEISTLRDAYDRMDHQGLDQSLVTMRIGALQTQLRVVLGF